MGPIFSQKNGPFLLPGKWAQFRGAKGEPQQLRFTLCPANPCPFSGRQNGATLWPGPWAMPATMAMAWPWAMPATMAMAMVFAVQQMCAFVLHAVLSSQISTRESLKTRSGFLS